MQDVGGHRAKHRHHHDGQPVDRRDVAAEDELPDQRDDERDRPNRDRDIGVDPVNQVVGRRLAHPGRENFDDPEVDRELRDLADDSLSEVHGWS